MGGYRYLRVSFRSCAIPPIFSISKAREHVGVRTSENEAAWKTGFLERSNEVKLCVQLRVRLSYAGN